MAWRSRFGVAPASAEICWSAYSLAGQERLRKWYRLSERTLERIRALVQKGEVRVSAHGYDELAADEVQIRDVVEGLASAVVIEDYPEYSKGPCVLVLQRDGADRPVHVVWGIPAGRETPAVVVTAYCPDPTKWDETWQRRRR